MKTRNNFLFQLVVLVALTGTAIMMSCSMGRGVKNSAAAEGEKQGKTITVTGTALHAKAGAVVQTEKEMYYIRGKQDWGNLYNKKVKVTGKLVTEIHKAEDLKDENGNYAQGFSGTVNYLEDVNVEEVK